MTKMLLEKENPAVGTQDEGVAQYLREIRQYPLLSAEEERRLAMDCAQGNEEAIRKMVSSNLRLVVSIAREYAGRGVPFLDLIQEGSLGLLAAARKFDYTLDNRFSTYATKCIRQGMNGCIMNHAGLIRVPRYTMEKMRMVLAARSDLLQERGEEPSAREIGARCDMSEEKVAQMLGLLPQVFSLDAPAGSEENDALQMLLEDDRTPQPQQELVRRELKETMDNLLAMLNERQQLVVRLYFGMEDGVCHSCEEIGNIMNVSKERARQIKEQAMKKLQTLGTDLGLEDFLDE